jgi:DUF1680 family protein
MPPSVTTRLTPVPWKNVRFDDSFWKPRIETNRVTTLPYEYEQNKKTGALGAYQWEYPADKDRPWRIWVGDLGKWIEAASYSLGTHPDPQLEELVESVVQGILKGQKADGYLYSNVTSAEKRWANLRDLHEFYDVGHTVEGAVAYYEVTGRRQFLDAMCRCVDLLDANFGLEEG